MLDRGLRSADLIAGQEGATVLALKRENLLALCEDDAVLGTRLVWNIATAVAQRARFILWQLQRATRRQTPQAVREGEMARVYDQVEDEARQPVAGIDLERE
jgi:hypothetical protein